MSAVLFFGGQKSGKTRLAMAHTLNLSGTKKPYYIATYLNDYGDEEMQKRVHHHQREREDRFITIEEGMNLNAVVSENETYLVDCLSMWILNNLEKSEELLIKEIQTLLHTKNNFIFILNDVSSGIIPIDKISRRFVDLTGIIGQTITQHCDEVYQVNYGIQRRIK